MTGDNRYVATRNGSIGAFIGMLLPAIAATLGGLFVSREQVVLES